MTVFIIKGMWRNKSKSIIDSVIQLKYFFFKNPYGQRPMHVSMIQVIDILCVLAVRSGSIVPVYSLSCSYLTVCTL